MRSSVGPGEIWSDLIPFNIDHCILAPSNLRYIVPQDEEVESDDDSGEESAAHAAHPTLRWDSHSFFDGLDDCRDLFLCVSRSVA